MSSDYLKALDIGSGLNTSQIVDAIVNAEKVPKERRINNKIEARETQISSFSEIKSNLSSLQSNLSIYDGVNGLSLNKNGTSVTASITDKSKAGQFTHEIGVSSLAKAQTLEFDGFSSASASIGTGSLGFVFGTWSGSTFSANGTTGTVNITTGNDTLDGIAASINDASIGVSASVVQKTSTNYALVIKATTGASNAMQITATEDDISQNLDSISYTAYSSDTQVVAGTDASLTIDGISVTRASNTITDLVDGITLNLFSTTETNETIQATYDVEVALLHRRGGHPELHLVHFAADGLCRHQLSGRAACEARHDCAQPQMQQVQVALHKGIDFSRVCQHRRLLVVTVVGCRRRCDAFGRLQQRIAQAAAHLLCDGRTVHLNELQVVLAVCA